MNGIGSAGGLRPSAPCEAWRAMLLGTVAAGAVLFGYGRRAFAACSTLGTTMTCTGDLSAGVSATQPITVLNVNNLTADIAPAPGTDGINFASTGAITINSDTSPFAIITTGAGADGIFAQTGNATVTVDHTGDIVAGARGIYASNLNQDLSVSSDGNIQSVGPGIDAHTSGVLTIASTGDIATTGASAQGIYAYDYDGTITISSTGDITTQGGSAVGIESVAGMSATTITSLGSITTAGGSAGGISAYSLLADVTITSTGDIATAGTDANGINAFVNTGTGDVTITNTGNIAAGGASSDAIFARSSGGTVTVNSTGNVASASGRGIYARTAGNVAVTSVGDIAAATFGIAALGTAGTATVNSTGDIAGGANPGIFAQGAGSVTVTSVGNVTSSSINIFSGGIFAYGTSNAPITIVSTGDVTATGANAGALYARGLGDLSITILSGTVTGGSAGGAGVIFGSTVGADNTLTNFGTVEALSGVAVDARFSGPGNETVNNYGTITGNVTLGGGTNAFNNRAGALFNAGDTVDVGAFSNAGTFAPGGVGAIETTEVSDTMVQTASGKLAIDIGAGGASDQVMVSDTAALAGTVSVNVISLPAAAHQQFIILQALTSVTNQGLALSASPALHATLAFTATSVLLTTSVDFASISGLNRNERAIADNLDATFAAGGGGLAPILLGLLNTQGLEAYKAALDQLSPEVLSDAQIAALYASLGFANSLLSCKVNGTTTASIIHEGQCLWAGASAVFLDSGTTSQQIGFDQTAGLFAAGAQVALDNVWRLGLGAGYQSSSLETATGATSEGEQAQGGVAVKYNPGPFLLAGVVNAGRGWYDTTRPISFTGFSGTATSDSTIDVLNGGVRVAYVLGSPHVYWKPMLDAAATRLDLGGFSETGGGAANLTVLGTSPTITTIAPSLEVGTEWWLANGTLIRPFLRGGVAWYEGGDLALSAGFLGAPAGVSPFTIHTDMDEVMGTVGAGLDVINGNDAVLHFAYDGQLGDTTQIHAVALKGSARF